jgi:hypothetical protein
MIDWRQERPLPPKRRRPIAQMLQSTGVFGSGGLFIHGKIP